jgi:DNA-binding Xre family transcriptional regulator
MIANEAMIRFRLGEILAERERAGTEPYNPFQLAAATGLHYASVHRLTHGTVQRLDMDALDRICTALGVTPGELLVQDTPKRRGRA